MAYRRLLIKRTDTTNKLFIIISIRLKINVNKEISFGRPIDYYLLVFSTLKNTS